MQVRVGMGLNANPVQASIRQCPLQVVTGGYY